MDMKEQARREINRLTGILRQAQSSDGAWRMCIEGSLTTDASLLVLLCSLGMGDDPVVPQLADRLLRTQDASGAWKLFSDERDGNLSATVEAYNALLFSGRIGKDDPRMAAAKRFIIRAGGLGNVTMLTRISLSVTGQVKWSNDFLFPIEIMLIPPASPVGLFDISAYARVHAVPVMIAYRLRYTLKTDNTPDLSDLQVHSDKGLQAQARTPEIRDLWDAIFGLPGKLLQLPGNAEKEALKKAEQFMLDRIEPDGSLYSYVSSTLLMIYALLALGYDAGHPVIRRAISAIKGMICANTGNGMHIQNFTSTVWDTALISHALQEAGIAESQPEIGKSVRYLLAMQQTRYGDWQVHNPSTEPGGWGFSANNTRIPDIDDTSAALRALARSRRLGTSMLQAWNKGLNWLLSMQNDDGGWPAFEKNTNNPLLTKLPIMHARDALTDPSTADLTGRTLDFLGRYAGLGMNRAAVRKGVRWLLDHQEADGSWYGRWGVCYIYGTWASVTGLRSAGVAADHPALRRAEAWLLRIQRMDGGFGESCVSDVNRHYTALSAGTLSQTAWAVDALLALTGKPTPAIERAIRFLIEHGSDVNWTTAYPTGAGLPGSYYIRYHSYRYIWPLVALAHYADASG